MTIMKKYPSRNHTYTRLIHLLQLVLPILCVILTALCAKRIRFLDYTPESIHESTDTLANPYIGFYTMTGITLSDTDLPFIPDTLQSSTTSTQLVMLEINLLSYRDCNISDAALSHLDDYLSQWKASGHQLIVRFLYDWNGNNLTSEPDSIEQVMTHMKQVAPVINRYKDTVYLLQGIFVGNCGEMNQSKHLNQDSMTALMNTLASNIDPSIYLSVRTPRHRRMILNSAQIPTRSSAFDGSLSSRLGLFNDGMLGSANDIGTYGDGSHKTDEFLEQWSRKDELNYQNKLCRYVPNGGEVIINNPCNDLNQALSDLRTMHVSYLNKDYDTAVLDKWKENAYTGKDTRYSNISGYEYIADHLGYRYALTGSGISRSSLFDRNADYSFKVKNTGFSNAYRSFDVNLSIVNENGKLLTSIPVTTDTRLWNAGTETNLTVSIPVSNYTPGKYQIYIKISDPVLNREIQIASDSSHGQYGYLLGHISLSHLPERSK